MNRNVLETIGNTPLVQLTKVVPPGSASVFVKLEYFNPTGSYKDRMALAMITEAEQRGALKPGMTVVECTGGSTGTSLALVCALKGYPFKVISSDAFAKEKLLSMQLFGANLEIVSSENGQITPDLIPRMIEMTKQLQATGNFFWTQQFENLDALIGYRQMGTEILQQLDHVDIFCAATGTAGMLTGVAQALKKRQDATRVVVLEPASAPIISQGKKGPHKVDGIGVGFVPPLLAHAGQYTVRTVEESAARAMAKRLAREEGIFAGTSSGLNVAAALELAAEIGPGHNVVAVACDSGMKYISGGLFN